MLISKRRVVKVLQFISERLDDAIAGNISPVVYDESLASSIIEKLNQFLTISERKVNKVSKENQIVKSLISDITHQIKTPLSNILIYSQLLEGQDDLSGESREMLITIQNQSQKLNLLVEDMIKISQMEMGLICIHLSTESIDNLICNCCQTLKLKAEKKLISINWKPCNIICNMDMKWMQEAIGNILDNAIKYSAPGSSIDIEVVKYESFYCISVKDCGFGISEEEQGMIFDRFYRSSDAMKEEGIGIGLYLARKIIQEHYGYIKVCSIKGEGSDFRVFLPRHLSD